MASQNVPKHQKSQCRVAVAEISRRERLKGLLAVRGHRQLFAEQKTRTMTANGRKCRQKGGRQLRAEKQDARMVVGCVVVVAREDKRKMWMGEQIIFQGGVCITFYSIGSNLHRKAA